MAFKSILTVTSGSHTRPEALDAAAQLARREDGHLEVLCLGIDRVQVGYYFDTASPALMEEGLAHAREEAAATRAEVTARLQAAGVAVQWSSRTAVAQIGAIPEVVGQMARFNDIVVLPRQHDDETEAEEGAILEAALFDGRAPVLVVPEAPIKDMGRRIVIGWNRSVEALVAVRAALPLLRQADRVDLVTINPGVHPADQSDPGGALSRMLSRHGVSVEVVALPRTMPQVSDVLLRHAADVNADLIVMGAYGHSRFREAILGGATRDMLSAANLPVFMAH